MVCHPGFQMANILFSKTFHKKLFRSYIELIFENCHYIKFKCVHCTVSREKLHFRFRMQRINGIQVTQKKLVAAVNPFRKTIKKIKFIQGNWAKITKNLPFSSFYFLFRLFLHFSICQCMRLCANYLQR